jgi:HlyD family secretion protein
MRGTLLAVLSVIVLVGMLAAANLRRDPSGHELDWRILRTPAREVAIEPPTRGPVVQTVTAPGAVELVEEAQIASQIIGRVVEVRVKDGDRVQAGDLLVRLDDTDAKARLDSAIARIERLQAAIQQAQSERDKARRDLERSNLLASRGVATVNELADARTLMAKAEAALTMSKNELIESEAMRTSAEEELRRTRITAPIDGVVAGLDVEVGEIIIAGTTNLPGTVLMTVGDPTRMQVRADVDETDIPLVRPSQPARVYLQADPTHPIAGSVDLVAPKGKKTEEVVSFETLVAVGSSEGTALLPGMTATVEIEVKRAEDALGVPVQAVVHRRRKDLPDTPAVRAWAERHARTPGEKAAEAEARYVKIVFVAENGVARARPVETGISDEKRVEILSGLKPDDRVIVGPFRALDELKDGDAVIPAKAGDSTGEPAR